MSESETVTLTANERQELVDQLVDCSLCGWNENDREVLNGLSDVTLAKLYKQAEILDNVFEKKEGDFEDEDEVDKKTEIEDKEVEDSRSDKVVAANSRNATLSEQDRADLAFARKYRMERKQQHVSVIMNSKNNRFTRSQLFDMNDAVLENIASLAQNAEDSAVEETPPSFFGAAAGAVNNTFEEEEPLVFDKIDYTKIAGQS